MVPEGTVKRIQVSFVVIEDTSILKKYKTTPVVGIVSLYLSVRVNEGSESLSQLKEDGCVLMPTPVLYRQVIEGEESHEIISDILAKETVTLSVLIVKLI